jgi:hypothetical protein
VPAKQLDLGFGRGGTDEHAVTSRAMDLFDDQFAEVREDVVHIFLSTQHPCVDVADQRCLPEVEANHVGHVRIDRFIVGNAGAYGIGDRDMAGAIGGQ